MAGTYLLLLTDVSKNIEAFLDKNECCNVPEIIKTMPKSMYTSIKTKGGQQKSQTSVLFHCQVVHKKQSNGVFLQKGLDTVKCEPTNSSAFSYTKIS